MSGPSDDPERHEIDLHGLRPEQALRRLEQELHAARVRGVRAVRVITGRGWGNRAQKPILRGRVEIWLRAHAASLGVRATRIASKGGAVDVDLG